MRVISDNKCGRLAGNPLGVHEETLRFLGAYSQCNWTYQRASCKRQSWGMVSFQASWEVIYCGFIIHVHLGGKAGQDLHVCSFLFRKLFTC